MTVNEPSDTEATEPGPVDGAVSAANTAFYDALEQGDIERMADLWGRTHDVLCAHPGRIPLRGWTDVVASWRAIFRAGGNPQIIVTDEQVSVRGDVAWVTVTENMLSEGAAGAASALNIFHHGGDRWLMVAHHAGPVLG